MEFPVDVEACDVPALLVAQGHIPRGWAREQRAAHNALVRAFEGEPLLAGLLRRAVRVYIYLS